MISLRSLPHSILRGLLAVSFFLANQAGAFEGRTILSGSDPLEQQAAQELREWFFEARGLDLEVKAETPEGNQVGPAIVIGTPATSPRIAAAHQKNAFELDAEEHESYHITCRPGSGYHVWLVGQSPKGAMNAVFRFMDLNPAEPADAEQAGSPAFRLRVGGHLFNQHPPPDWSDDDQARFYARNFINVVWGEKRQPPLPLEARQKYGLGVMLEATLPPVGSIWKKEPHHDAWINDPAHASAIYKWGRHSWYGDVVLVIDPFDPIGRQAYVNYFDRLLSENPDTRVLYAIFGDYSWAPNEDSTRVSDRKPFPHTHDESIREIMSIMKDVVNNDEVIIGVWMWLLFPEGGKEAFMVERSEAGYGVIFNENSDGDNWIYKRDNFHSAALPAGPDGTILYGERYLPLVSAGGTCESIGPAIALPLPHVAWDKMNRLAGVDARNFVLWWGSGEGWTYNANLSLIREMIWTPAAYAGDVATPFDPASPHPLLKQVARRDFGDELAPDILAYWQAIDHALVTDKPSHLKPEDPRHGDPSTDGLHIFNWYQRLGTYTEPAFDGTFPLPITPTALSNLERTGIRQLLPWGAHPVTHENFATAIENLKEAGRIAENILATRAMSSEAETKLRQMHFWVELYRLIQTSLYNHLRAIAVFKENPDAAPDSDFIRTRLEPTAAADIENNRRLIEWIHPMPANFNLTIGFSATVANKGDRDSEIRMLRNKIAVTEIWLHDLQDLARGKTAVASSSDPETLGAFNVVDGDASTRWGSKPSDDQWIRVDLGKVQPVASVVLNWRPSYGKAYEIQVSTEKEPQSWTTVYQTETGAGGSEVIALPPGTQARHVQMRGLKRATNGSYSLTGIEVYGIE